MKKTLIMGAMLLAVAGFTADRTIDLSKTAAWNTKWFQQKDANTLLAKNNVIVTTKELIKLEDKHTYNFSGEITQAPGCTPNSTYIGYQILDKDKKVISMIMGSGLISSTTELVKPIRKGDKSFTIKANKQWVARGHYYVGFDVKKDKLSRRNSTSSIKEVKKVGDNMVITLGRPIGADFPTGTKVRIQNNGGYFYSGYNRSNAKWVKFGKPLKKNQFWVEAEYVRPMLLLNWGTPKGTAKDKIGTMYKNMKLEIKEIK